MKVIDEIAGEIVDIVLDDLLAILKKNKIDVNSQVARDILSNAQYRKLKELVGDYLIEEQEFF
jgi:hypothetical protein